MSDRHRSRSKDGVAKEKRSGEKSREKSQKSSSKERSRLHRGEREEKRERTSSKHREKKREEAVKPPPTSSKPRSGRSTDLLPPRPTTTQRRSSAKKEAAKEPQPAEDDYQYEDDFEDYEDDFEDDEEAEAVPAPSASNQRPKLKSIPEPLKNDDEVEESPMLQRLLNRKSSAVVRDPVAREQGQHRISSANRKIVFANAKQIDLVAASAVVQRYAKLKDLIGMETTSFRVDDLPPMRDYDFYMSMFGIGNRTQNFCQTGDENYASECQTELAENFETWTQHPPVDERGWGREGFAQIEDEATDADTEVFKNSHAQNPRLKKFLEVAADLIIEILNTEANNSAPVYTKNKSEFAFSAGFNILSLANVAKESQCTFVVKNKVKPNQLLGAFVVFKGAEAVEAIVSNRSVIVDFNWKNVELPENILICENEVKCCCYAPDGKSAIFAGLNDGTVVAWDLREPAPPILSASVEWTDKKERIPLRRPAYDSSFQYKENGTSIVQISTSGDSAKGSYQVVTLEETGSITVWSVFEDSAGDFDVDLGLRPGARFKLAQSTVIPSDTLVSSVTPLLSRLFANEMILSDEAKTQFLVGTDVGYLVSKNRMRSLDCIGPRRILLKDVDSPDPMQVMAMKMSPFYSDLILIGLSSGSLIIYEISTGSELVSLSSTASSRQAVTSVEWSPLSPSVFYSIHDGDRLLVWDLQSTRNALHVCAMKEKIQAKVLRTDSWTDGRLGYLALALSNGLIQLHCLEPMNREGSVQWI
ncbi:hypothetical protein L596_024136 [Steinernema carpocapsae]|uniref:WD repeat-containing protein 60 n=1 Tax=Steinernema carpocapsae TaxID=34508 RepID=A0A4U5MGI9_STECR|nr:hypothetical protein L596_024136 [Steinernema carpocapsae]